jgi:hypothetical protein
MSLSGPTFVPKWPKASSASSEKYKYAKYHLMPWWKHYQGAIKTSSSTARHSKKKQKTHINGHWPKPVFVALPNPQDTYRAKYIYAFLITQLREFCNVTFISQNQPKTSTLVN